MTQLKRWDNDAVIHEGDGTIAELVEACGKLGISAFRANLYGANLRSANLESANLRSANLRSANLRSANLYGANLESANLYGANLESANLYGANLYGANLYGANLYGANLYGANLESANLESANLRSANLPIWCRWAVSYQLQPDLVVSIGCKRMSIPNWDAVFSAIGDDYEAACRKFTESELGSRDHAIRIRANYLAVRAYLVALGHHTDAP